MRILIAPDKFKGSLTAKQSAAAMAAGARRVFPEAAIDCRPVADGGEGTVDALLAAIGGRLQTVEVSGPAGGSVGAEVGWLEDGRAAVEISSAAGLALLSRPDPLRASSRGCGELIAHILRRAPETSILVGIGGSASTDGGTGAARALGWRFLDTSGRELDEGGASLQRLARIDAGRAAPFLETSDLRGWTDVDNPLIGPRGSARAFAPQKGASPEEVEILEEGLQTLAAVIKADLGVEVAEREGSGAAGGIGAGLIAFFGAKLVRGFDAIADAVGLPALVARADIVLTGEGRLDVGSLGGKTVIGVARLARASGTRCFVVAGQVALNRSQLTAAGLERAVSLVDRFGSARAHDETSAALADATAELLTDTLGSAPHEGYSGA